MVIAFLFGMFIGVTLGIVAAGLMCAAGKDSKESKE